MPNPAVLMAAVGGASSLLGQRSANRAATQASGAQVQTAQMGIDEQKRQFDAIRKLMAPFVNSGVRANNQVGNLAGVNGPDLQRRMIGQIASGPEMTALTQQGENSILANGSATGGLRGGNVQGALAQFRPAQLAALIQQRFGQLSGIAGAGQGAATGVGAAGQNMATNVAGLYGDQGAARAGGALAIGQNTQNLLGNISQGFGNLMAYRPAMPEGAGMLDRWGF